MRPRPVAVVASIICVLVASHGHAGTLAPPTDQTALLAWLESGAYRARYKSEPSVHESAEHGFSVRVYVSPALARDLRAGRRKLRKGAAAVKELYLRGTDQVVGYAVMRKVRRRSGPNGEGWLFYETFDRTNERAFFGQGLALCTGCHRAGRDYFLSEFQP